MNKRLSVVAPLSVATGTQDPVCTDGDKYKMLRGVVAVLFALVLLPVTVVAQNANDAFYPNANDSVLALAVQPNGKILLGGQFTTLNGGATTRNYIARLNADGSVDSAFDPNANSPVVAIAVQPDGKILLGGSFTTFNGGATVRNRIARLNADGSVDSAFNPIANSNVYALAVQPDGKILLGGSFTTLNAGATMRNYIARLNADGSVDDTFDPNANGVVYALTVQSDSKILLGGGFTTLNGGAITRNSIAQLNADGSVDSTFDPNANGSVFALAVQPDGKILFGGAFTSLNGGATARNGIARLNADGSIDSTFDPNANSAVFALAVQPDGKILLAGAFTTMNGGATTRNYIARLNADSSVDSTFNPNADNTVYSLAVQPDGKILLGGYLTTLNGGAATCNYVTRLNVDGSGDSTFNANANDVVYALAVQPDGKSLLGGGFTTMNGGARTRNYIARRNADGRIDLAFDPNANGSVFALAVQPDGKILLGGLFTTLNGGAITRNGIARLNADGSVDSPFDPNANGVVYALAVQPDGKILLGGNFTTLNGGAVSRNRVARLNTDGSVDSTFDPNANSYVFALAVQPDGKILLGGNFTTLNGGVTARNYIARLNADGSIDNPFDPNAVGGNVSAFAVQPDGKILLGGAFTTLNGGATVRNRIARLNADGSVDSTLNPNANAYVSALAVQPDGKILLGGAFTILNGGAIPISRNRIARLNAGGSVDSTFNPNANDSVNALAVQPDGKILLGGSFTTLDGGATTRNYSARLSTPDAALQSLAVNGANVTWKRSGAGPELAQPPSLEYSLDGSSYTLVGSLARVVGGWRGGGITQPVGQMFYLRARGAVSSGQGNGSQGLIESVREFYGNDRIFADGFE